MEFKKEKIYTPLVATPTHNVSQAIKYGDLVFVSGMVGEDENEVLREGLEAQCEQAFLNMKRVLEAAGSSLEKVLFCQIFIGKREDRAIDRSLIRTLMRSVAQRQGTKVSVEIVD